MGVNLGNRYTTFLLNVLFTIFVLILILTILGLVLASWPHRAKADTLRCSQWNDTTTCDGPNGYVSHEDRWNDTTTGRDNEGNTWTTNRWHDQTTTTFHRRGK